MGKIAKTIQPKHRETLSPWLQQFVDNASTVPLSTLPQVLETFPSRWPFPRGDLYHWIPLLNKFDDILEKFCATYKLSDGPQTRDFGCEVLLQAGKEGSVEDNTEEKEKLVKLGYREDGDVQLVIAVLTFTQMLLDHCGNRSIYASSSSLNHLLNSTDLHLICAALHVGVELAQRYQASVKRMGIPPRQVHSALLANHYNIDLDRVQQLAQPFVKTPIVKSTAPMAFSTPTSATKNKDKPHGGSARNSAVMYANDLCAIAKPDSSEKDASDARWNGWGDIKVTYYPASNPDHEPPQPTAPERIHSSAVPATPTPLRRSSTAIGAHTTPRSARQAALDDSPVSSSGSPAAGQEATSPPNQRSLEIPQSSVASISIYKLLARAPEDLPKDAGYEFLNRLRVAQALLGPQEARQLALKARLLAIQNLAYIHMEHSFAEKVLRQDQDEPRRYQLVYQLAELIHPASDGSLVVPIDLQAIALSLLEAISGFTSKIPDIFSALNATVNHGVLLYVIRKAVAEMKDDDTGSQWTIEDEWRENLFSLTLHITMAMANTARSTPEIISAGLLDVLVDILNIRSNVAERTYGTLVGFLDSLVYNVQASFQTLVTANGLEAITQLVTHEVHLATTLAVNGNSTPESHRSLVVDYEIPFYQQQNLKFLLKFIHHSMTNAFSHGGNTDRLLRNLVDQSDLLASIRQIIENAPRFGSLVWTNAVTILSDFLNNDPTSFAAVSEAGLVKSFLEAVTGHDVSDTQSSDNVGEEAESTQSDLAEDTRPHPPPRDSLRGRSVENLARSILPSTDVITTIPTVINAISLNNIGMKMVVQSRAFDSFFEVFESPTHVRVLANDADLAQNVGGLFDELARHHPALRPAIANAVLDMVARVTAFAFEKAQGKEGWGAKLHGADSKEASKEPAAISLDDTDVDMADANVTAPMSDPEAQQRPSSPRESVTPYIFALANFLLAYVGNPSLKTLLIQKGGVELLLDLSAAPSLVHDFGSTHASRHLQVCLSQLIETSPIVGLPSLLKRTQECLDALEPLVRHGSQGDDSFFAPFLTSDRPDPKYFADGASVVKALLNAQCLMRTLFQCYPYSSRAQTITLHSVNVFDYYDRLIGSIGPLLRTVILEEMAIGTCVPAHWSAKKDSPTNDRQETSSAGNTGGDALGAIMDDSGIPDVLSQALIADEKAQAASKAEQSTPRYRNFRTIRGLLHSLMPTAFPLLQTFGKALLPRRERDGYTRAHHARMADRLSQTILLQLDSLGPGKPSKDYQYWIIMLHTVHEMLIDRRLDTRHVERTGNHIIAPVLVAFKKHGGLDKLNELLDIFNHDLCRERAEGEDASLSRLASIGMKKILDLYTLLVNGKTVSDSVQQVNLIQKPHGSSERRHDQQVAPNLVVELRMAILPAVRKLWDSSLVEKTSAANLTTKIINILRAISEADSENSAYRNSESNSPPPYLQPTLVPFPWSSVDQGVRDLVDADHPRDLAQEAVYRANNTAQLSTEYCTAHAAGLAGTRNPIPELDAPTSAATDPTEAAAPSSDTNIEEESMLIDTSAGIVDENGDVAGTLDTPIEPSTIITAARAIPPVSSEAANETETAIAVAVSRDDLDKARSNLRENLIDRCLDVIREHPDSTHEISELIRATSLRMTDDVSSRQEIGETLVNALMSFAAEDDFKPVGRSIAAYAHLLSLLLQDKDFFKATVDILKENVTDLLRFLELPASLSSEELPPWIPYILLVLEILISDDEQPAEIQWKPPTSEADSAEPLLWPDKDLNIKIEERKVLLEAIIAILPRIGKEESLAVSVLRILVIVTRDRSFARTIGQQSNLQRLFVMAKQLCGVGSARLNDKQITSYILIVLRHVIEDEEALKQIMRTQIRAHFDSTRRGSSPEITNFIRQLSTVALRDPKLFVQVANEMIKLPRWSPQDQGMGHRQAIMLKEQRAEVVKDDVAPAVRATEDLSIQDVKQTTEEKDKAIEEQSKSAADNKRPMLENPDGVVHFLLCELQNYRAVDDIDPSPSTSSAQKDNTHPGDAPGTSDHKDESTAGSEGGSADAKDKNKKSPFKPDEHPIFVYRCFLLHCLTELLQSYNRTKMEFVNFKRGAPLQTNTPIKPRSTALNYLLNDLLCSSSWADATLDTLATKKKQATAALAQNLLVALVSKTGEKAIDRTRDKYDYEDEPDLLFVRKFVLDTTLKSYKDASFSNDPFDVRYAKMLALAEVVYVMMGDKDKETPMPSRSTLDSPERSQAQIRRLMYEKGYLSAMTASIADIDLAFPPVKRTIKYILRVLRILTSTAIHLSHSNIIATPPNTDILDDEIASATSLSEIDDDREETPDLYRNSALGLNEPGRAREGDYSDDDEDDDDEMYDEEYDDEMEYDDDDDEIRDPEEDISEDDEEEEEMGGMGPIEGLPGDLGVVEVTMDDDDDDDEDDEMDEDDDDEEDSSDESDDSDEMDDIEDRIEIVDEDGNPLEDDGASGWESPSDEDENDVDGVEFGEHDAELDGPHVHSLGEDGAPRIGDIMRAVDEDFQLDDLGDRFIQDDDDDEDEGDEDLEDEYAYEDDYPNEAPLPNIGAPGLGWDTTFVVDNGGMFGGHPGHRHRHGGVRSPLPPLPFMMGTRADPLAAFADGRGFARGHRHDGRSAGNEDGTNPLLRRGDTGTEGPARGFNPQMLRLGFPGSFFGAGNLDNPMAFINELVSNLPIHLNRGNGQALHFQITQGPRGEVRELSLPLDHHGHQSRPDRRDQFQEPSQATAFSSEPTSQRWMDEVKMIFGQQHTDKSARLVPLILSYLVPPAMKHERELAEIKRKQDEERKKVEEEERKARQVKEAEERANREKQEAAERERAATEAAELAAQVEAESTSAGAMPNESGTEAMEGVEATQVDNEASQGGPSTDQPRVYTTIRGEQVDITDLGIDADYLEALPEEFREEVIAQTISTRRQQAREAPGPGEQTEVFQEFLDALPRELRMEIVQQERAEQRRREHQEARRQATSANPGQMSEAQDMDPASILMTLPPELREQVLIEQGADIMDTLPPEMAAQARRLVRPEPHANEATSSSHAPREQITITGQPEPDKNQRRAVVQMLDKSGVATLLRLMFINVKGGSLESSLKHVFKDVCENRFNRSEVINTLLQILQDGTTDIDAVERSFVHLSIKAKQPRDKDFKTPQSLKRSATGLTGAQTIQPSSETSPLLIVQQCLDLLGYLAEYNVHVPSLFLTEHEASGLPLKRTLSRKGKNKDVKAHKYAINSLLALLDRDLVMESSAIMDSLSSLLSRVTFPLLALERKKKEALGAIQKLETVAAAAEARAGATTATGGANVTGEILVVTGQSSAAVGDVSTSADNQPAVSEPAPEGETDPAKLAEKKLALLKKLKHLHPPIIPVQNLTLIINIFVARECSSRTFKETLSTIKNLSAVPGAMLVFGEELAKQAQMLSEKIVKHLDDLLPHIENATSGTEIQGVALAKFSPGASDQNKLLRVLTALDHLFAQKKSDSDANDAAASEEQARKKDLLSELYRNATFNALWEKLSACLSAIRERENLINVATILLPLIESLMVVCKDNAQAEAQSSKDQDKDMLLMSPAPESRIASLFFTFTEEHRRILNELVRNNPNLMKGTFSNLVKNPKVLEFDNKRSWFTRSVHNKGQVPAGRIFPTLQLQVRRDQVFQDSFKTLYFKSGDEMKFGKLNIRFHGEEGVDAGGVTREWFQVLSRQMFDPNYALFVPVSSDRTTFHPNKLSGINDEHLLYFKFIGRVIGKALYEGRVLDCYFSRAVYKRILGKQVSVKDMESFDPDYYKSLVWMLENDITDIITETFSVETDEFGVTRIEDLRENGRNIPVTEENKQEYVRLVVEHKLLSSVREQMEQFLKGFHEIIPADLISIFNEQELELLISGLPDIDVDDWKGNTEYHNYNPSSQQIQWFWRALRSFDKEELAKLLQFVTGTSKVPLNGFKELEGMNGINRFNIHRDYGNKDRLPSSHTCFNQLDLPEYDSYDMLRSQLLKAITAGSEYFGFA